MLATITLTLPLAAFGVSLVTAAVTAWSHIRATHSGEIRDADDRIKDLEERLQSHEDQLGRCKTRVDELLDENVLLMRKVVRLENGKEK